MLIRRPNVDAYEYSGSVRAGTLGEKWKPTNAFGEDCGGRRIDTVQTG
jgi:hypothetical protein